MSQAWHDNYAGHQRNFPKVLERLDPANSTVCLSRRPQQKFSTRSVNRNGIIVHGNNLRKLST